MCFERSKKEKEIFQANLSKIEADFFHILAYLPFTANETEL